MRRQAGKWFATFNALPRTEGQLGASMMEIHLFDPKAKPFGLDPITVSGLPLMWTQSTLAQHPHWFPSGRDRSNTGIVIRLVC